ncbi:related to glucosidase II, alpha subunit [Phialocephala subalpina]|uniref:alpha-D-xyloside xylohydrolase n=1 Tax=Phialocephala subalpina TaxID=576137 RepID=A0A1L7WBW0_9HELO|nr:related to glucosidase II, alpha subunit [Phialocephala subalpina]
MKFTNGIWFDREHTQIYNAVEVGGVTHLRGNEIRALCTTRHIRDRGDTLNKPTITVTLSSPAPNIIACTATHFRGVVDRTPPTEFFPDVKPDASETPGLQADGANISIVAGGLTAELNTTPSAFNILYRSTNSKTELTEIGWSCLQYIIAPAAASISDPQIASTTIADPYYRAPISRSNKPHMAVSLGLQVGELVYGLGERFGPLVKNGQSIELWNEDAGTCTPYTYKNIPFYLTNRGYGVFFDHTDAVSLEIQNEKLAKVQASVQGEQIRWYIIYGPSPKEILKTYTILTGRPPLPPAWSFGLWLSTSFLTDYSEDVVTTQLERIKTESIPMSVLHFDCFWMKAHKWCNFTFDPVYFPDIKGFLSRIHARGYKVCVWINPYIAQDSEVFMDAMERGFLIKRSNGDVWQSDIWQAGMGVVDFTNPGAVKWYEEHLLLLLEQGVDCFKTDFGERIPWEDVVFHDGMDPRVGHNHYAKLYNRTVYDAITKKRGIHEAVLFARAATIGSQRYPVHWGGDCESTWNGMAQSLRGGLSLGMSGFGFWSHDIGGFMSEGQSDSLPDKSLYKRWVQFGLLSSHSRLHGSKRYRVPWDIDNEATDILRKYTELKNSLMPYLFAQALEATKSGVPMMRAMVLEFPDDRVCQSLDAQYMLGESLLVAPIFNAGGRAEFYLPAGTWVGLLDGKTRRGPSWHVETFSNDMLPVLVRENHTILIGQKDRPDYDWEVGITQVIVGAFSLSGSLEVKVPSAKTLGEYGRDGNSGVDGIGERPKCVGDCAIRRTPPIGRLLDQEGCTMLYGPA